MQSSYSIFALLHNISTTVS